MSNDTTSTSSSLIRQLKERDASAWQRLTRLYGPAVYGWARKSGLQDSDAADVMQEVFRAVATAIDKFQSDQPGSSFRGWLWTITRNEIRASYNRRQTRPDATGGTDAQQQWQLLPDLEQEVASSSEVLDSVGIAHRAVELVRDEFEERTWLAFWRAAVANQSAGEIARDLDMTEGAVRQAKYRVLCRLREMMEEQ